MKKQTWQQWARLVQKDQESPSKIRRGSLAALTGTDVRALDAFVACLELYAYTGNESAMQAAGLSLLPMQVSTRWIAKELIAFVLEWESRERLWPRIARWLVNAC
jgi:hypothetical protein